ncbi:MAG: CDP-alcohol phosphatidyltransferase family protein [Candidatus Woesearchaeota archaeon]|nr:CDP-alcohol phosphatidyltransferase family protein [Candidatus Woesearchaeota archaeon]
MKPADYITLCNGMAGVLAILFIRTGNIPYAAGALIAAVLLDYADGFVAKKTKPTKFGMHLDALADMISFGVAPVAIMFVVVVNTWVVVLAGIVFVAAGMYRLARFQTKNSYQGMPITVNGVVVPLLLLTNVSLLPLYFLLASCLMVSTFRWSR